jgi:hypothetical protein
MKAFCVQKGLFILQVCILMTTVVSDENTNIIESFDEMRLRWAKEATPNQQSLITSVFKQMRKEPNQVSLTVLKSPDGLKSKEFRIKFNTLLMLFF